MFYTIARFILLLLCKTCFRFCSFGIENFPENGPLIVASNHASFFDPVIVGIGTSRKLYYLARESLFRFRPFGKLLSSVNTLPLKREGSDVSAFKLVLNKLAEGKAVLIFPEGTRSTDGSLQRPRQGIGFLEKASGAAILPCYVKGSIEVLPKNTIFPRFRQICVYYGKPLRFDSGFSGFSGNKKEWYNYVAREVMSAIAELKKDAEENAD